MFDVGFTEIVVILGVALVVLGPEKLPSLAQKVGRWTGRARAMARQLHAQLEHEVTLEELARSKPTPPARDSHVDTDADAAEKSQVETAEAHDPLHGMEADTSPEAMHAAQSTLQWDVEDAAIDRHAADESERVTHTAPTTIAADTETIHEPPRDKAPG